QDGLPLGSKGASDNLHSAPAPLDAWPYSLKSSAGGAAKRTGARAHGDAKMTSLFCLKVMGLGFVVVALGSLPATGDREATSSPSTFDRAKDSIRPALGPGPWYWENPRPQGNPLLAVFVLDTDDVWAGGSRTLMHWDGKDWTLTDVQPSYGYS